MRYRLFFVAVTAFFITMNALLFRSEFGAGRPGASVPVATVWEKVLTCPDNSFLEIRHKGVKVGRAHWAASISEQAVTEAAALDDAPPEGMVKEVTGYSLDFDGSFAIDDATRLRFTCGLRLETNQVWREFSVRFTLKPELWELIASAPDQTLRFITDGADEGRKEQVFTFADLRRPDKLARALGGPLLPATLGAMGLSLNQARATNFAAGIQWTARNDSLAIGRNELRVYRLEARLLDRAKIVLLISPVGEILRMELPGDVVLNNEQLASL